MEPMRAGAGLRPLTTPNGDSYAQSVSADGRFVGFDSNAWNLVPGDTNENTDVFVSDRVTGTTARVDVTSSGAQAHGLPRGKATGANGGGMVSANGRYVAFDSAASNLVPGDANGVRDVFVRDRVKGTTVRVSVSSTGEQGDGNSFVDGIRADGRYVVFDSDASNLVPGDTNRAGDIFVHDRLTGTTERVSVSSTGRQADDFSDFAAISADGRVVAFTSSANNLVSADSGAGTQVFAHDMLKGTTELVSIGTGGVSANDESDQPSISGDGRYVAFESAASNLVPDDTNNAQDVFVRDRRTATTELVSVSSSGAQGNDESGDPTISADGRVVAFDSGASNLVAGQTNPNQEVFVHDRSTGTTEQVSVSGTGAQANDESFNYWPGGISRDGRFVAFDSIASNLVAARTGYSPLGSHVMDVFVRDRAAGTTTLVTVNAITGPRAGRLLLRPWPVRAGALLNAAMPVTVGGGPVAYVAVYCLATLAGRTLIASEHRFAGGVAHCTWAIPQEARGKRFVASLAAVTPGGKASKNFASTVR
jgi:archaellum component FlaF (FlaF/FlaG flagellin family)